MARTRRQFMLWAGSIISLSVGGCVGTNDERGIPVIINNESDFVHTIAIIITDQDGNTDYYANTASIKSAEEKTLENKVSLPDSLPKEVWVRLLLDTGETLEFTSTLDIGESITARILESEELATDTRNSD